ncbi:mechanosensitive ion channel family protein [Mucilaginibacter aquaedulcis]|uniref:mechanosensitive ion channel family protein n=1 Tax=Mucilaginibacter aquaedulcis TaxID=1187081 RepID=UPI0025B48C00|nr:mechanosensitive ion channel domain-containing protein [Mucilaginibacter aquaedulcis]MDN3550682.1 mechanosensitive ion channel [Mucilaginibacter aquaedulcis]
MRYYITLLLLFFINTVSAQDSYGPPPDTAVKTPIKKPDFAHIMQKRGRDEAIRSIEVYNLGKATIHQREAIENLKRVNQETKIFLKEGIDTLAINNLLKQTRASVDIVKDGIFIHKGTTQTERNLSVSSSILSELSETVGKQKAALDRYANKLIDFRVNIDSLYSDSLLYKFALDSVAIVKYLDKIRVVVKEIGPVDTSLNIALTQAQALQLKVDYMVFELRSLKEDVDIYSNNLSGKAFYKEFPFLWESTGFTRPINDVIAFSQAKEKMVLNYYLKDHRTTLLILLLILCIESYFIYSLKQQHKIENKLNPDYAGQLLLQHPVLSATLLTLSVFQFIFTDPPYLFSFLVWLVSAVCLAFIFKTYITAYWMRFWLIMIAFFVVASLGNMLLQVTRIERICTALISIGGVVYTGLILFSKRRQELKERGILYFIVLVFTCEIIATLLNGFGRFNLSKAFFISGYSGIVIAIVFLWVVRHINEGLMLASDIYTGPSRKLFFINFNRVGSQVPPFFYVVLVIGWFYLVSKNFYGFYKYYISFNMFITRDRMVGNYHFSIWGILVFFLILILSLVLSKLASFFTSDPSSSQDKNSLGKKINLGSYILLVRIFIICMGLFFAFAAAGIALDKITVIFGALGVGVGLGLQGLVNNLVSGLILSFERPVNVGDLIEINGKTATMKSIGFRSSIVTSSDGSCIVIPNGELLNQHLVNWTMGQHLKRISFNVPVAYNTDLKKVKTLIMEILDADDRILRSPAFDVGICGFNESSVDVEVIFWPKHISLARIIKSDLILKIDEVFSRENIVIPFPQQDVYIKELPDNAQKKEKDDSPNSH